MDANQKIQRSVDSLERIYAVVVAFAVTKSIETVFFDPTTKTASYPILIGNIPPLIAFMVTIVPFYHGMHRHLSRTYIENTVDLAKQGFLLLDFFVFFIESCLLLVFASSLDSGQDAYIPLILLLTVDLIWAIITHGIHYKGWENGPWKWAAINVIAVSLLCFFLFSNIFNPGSQRVWALTGVTFLRTLFDYMFCWDFYFPQSVVK